MCLDKDKGWRRVKIFMFDTIDSKEGKYHWICSIKKKKKWKSSYRELFFLPEYLNYSTFYEISKFLSKKKQW